MDIAKPPGGFTVHEPDAVKAMIAGSARRWPRIEAYWSDIKARLAQTGHREGIPVRGPRARLYVADGDNAAGLPRIKVVYSVLGDGLSIHMVMVQAPDS
jgi:hypothetical protein